MLEQISNDLRTNIERMAVIGGAATLSRRLRDGVFFIILYRPLRIRCRLARKPDIFDTLQISPLGPPRRLRYSQLVAQVTLEIPDDLLAALETPGQELSRSIFEAAVLEAYRERKLSTAQVRRLLGFETGYELDGFLKTHQVWLEYSFEVLKRDREAHRKLAF